MVHYTGVQPDKTLFSKGVPLNFIGIDPHTNRFTCCYRNERSSVDNPKDKRIETFDLTDFGPVQFFKTLTADTCVLIEAAITTFSFARLFKDRVKAAVIANTCELKRISAYMPRLARCDTDKIDADKLCRIIRMQILAGEQPVSPVTILPKEIRDLRGLFPAYRLYQKQNTRLKNRIHSLLKEHQYGFTQEEIFDRKSRKQIREVSSDPVLKSRINRLMDRLERNEADVEALKERVLLHADPYLGQIDILTSMKGGKRLYSHSDYCGHY
jgi:transposase